MGGNVSSRSDIGYSTTSRNFNWRVAGRDVCARNDLKLYTETGSYDPRYGDFRRLAVKRSDRIFPRYFRPYSCLVYLMDLLFSEVVERFYNFLWPMIRISAFLIAAPFFSLQVVSVRIRILLALLLTWMIYPLIDIPVIDPSSMIGLMEVFNQALVGFIMGLILQVVTAALVVGGQTISMSMGLGMANMIDPNVGNVPLLSVFILIFSTLIFLGLGGHIIMLSLLVETFQSLPIGSTVIPTDLFVFIVKWSSMTFLGAVLIALPVMVSLLFINLGIGVITRTAPALNIFAVGFPAMIIAGIILFSVSMTSVGYRIQWLWLESLETIKEGFGLV